MVPRYSATFNILGDRSYGCIKKPKQLLALIINLQGGTVKRLPILK